jgi:hypothetical protein
MWQSGLHRGGPSTSLGMTNFAGLAERADHRSIARLSPPAANFARLAQPLTTEAALTIEAADHRTRAD